MIFFIVLIYEGQSHTRSRSNISCAF